MGFEDGPNNVGGVTRIEVPKAKEMLGSTLDGKFNNQYNVLPDVYEEMLKIKDEAIKNGNFMKGPNGKESNLPEKQWLIVRTNCFKKRFGDWENDLEHSSKVVDENGEPLVVYHGSTKMFETFDANKIGSTTGDNSGFYFTNDRRIAKSYYSKETGKFSDNLKLMFGVLKGHKSTVYDCFLKIPNIYEYDFKGNRDNIGREKIISDAKKNGYDGVILKNLIDGPSVVQQVYIVFDPNQIKSIDNYGSFSGSNNNIKN